MKSIPPRHCQKWHKSRCNICGGDIVIIQDDEDLPCNVWQLARVVETYPSADGYVHNAKLALTDNAIESKGERMKPMRYLDRLD